MIILDTNVLSEMMRQAPEPKVVKLLADTPAPSVFTTTITQAEILFGIELLPEGKRKYALRDAATAMFEQDFCSRILPFDQVSATLFAAIAARRQQLGHPISQFDAQIAAITRCHQATLATRNTNDFYECGIDLVNPWA